MESICSGMFMILLNLSYFTLAFPKMHSSSQEEPRRIVSQKSWNACVCENASSSSRQPTSSWLTMLSRYYSPLVQRKILLLYFDFSYAKESS